MDLGVVFLPEHRWSEGARLWRRAEELGFAHAWTYDHLAWRTLRDGPWFGSVPTLTAAATVTQRIRLGPLVASPNFRHPVPFAKELMTLDDVSGGRLVVGIGAGGYGWDSSVLGEQPLSPVERAARFAEFVELTDLLLRQPETTYRGRFYAADGATNHPGCVQRPRAPFAVAATGRRGMELAARFGDSWVTTGDPSLGEDVAPDDGARAVARQIERLDECCARVGRDPSTLRRMVLTGPQLDAGLDSEGAFGHALGCYAAVGVDDLVVHWPRPTDPYRGDVDTFERVVTSAL
ncbi:MAG TPA: LLM class flavin-dependent oxidoreductase [Acidimicrobiia bacterium]|nr:LLM class flavin-dependent oxidoreductase [Acidimicrobiia bacterium]